MKQHIVLNFMFPHIKTVIPSLSFKNTFGTPLALLIFKQTNFKINNGDIMSIKPLADRIVIEPQAAETKTASGLYIPDSAKEKPQKGTVIAVGVGRVADNGQTVAMELKEGDVVLYGKYAGTEVEVDNKTVVLMRESDVLAKF